MLDQARCFFQAEDGNRACLLLRGLGDVSKGQKYISQLRMNRAKELLVSTNQSVKEITSACGYYSQSHFTKLFIDHEGCTPTEFRKKSQEADG